MSTPTVQCAIVGKIVFVVREGVFHCKTCVKFPNLQTMTLAHLYQVQGIATRLFATKTAGSSLFAQNSEVLLYILDLTQVCDFYLFCIWDEMMLLTPHGEETVYCGFIFLLHSANRFCFPCGYYLSENGYKQLHNNLVFSMGCVTFVVQSVV